MSGFRRGGAGRRRDAVEKPIVDALRACGARCWRLGGNGLPDLLVRYGGRWTPLELKSRGGTLTPAQVESGAGRDWPVVETVPEALHAVGILAKGE